MAGMSHVQLLLLLWETLPSSCLVAASPTISNTITPSVVASSRFVCYLHPFALPCIVSWTATHSCNTHPLSRPSSRTSIIAYLLDLLPTLPAPNHPRSPTISPPSDCLAGPSENQSKRHLSPLTTLTSFKTTHISAVKPTPSALVPTAPSEIYQLRGQYTVTSITSFLSDIRDRCLEQPHRLPSVVAPSPR